MVSVVVDGAEAATVSAAGEKLHVAPVGRPLHASETDPAKELVGATLMVRFAEAPTPTVTTCEEPLTLKVGADVAVVELMMEPKSPWASFARPAVK